MIFGGRSYGIAKPYLRFLGSRASAAFYTQKQAVCKQFRLFEHAGNPPLFVRRKMKHVLPHGKIKG
ncbi:MAG: hypothetical protein D8M28_10530 [Proteobacteria bacterium]|nr:hypothetical protein [Pseudomonadota bacterium]